MTRARAVRIGVALAMIVGLGLAARSLPWRAAIAALPAAQPSWLALAVLLNVAALPLWAVQWNLLVAPPDRIGWRRMLEIVALTWSVQTTLTSLAGGAAGVALLVMRGGMSRGAAVSVFVVDQVLTGIAKLAIIGVAILLVPLPSWMWHGAATLAGLIAVSIIVLAALVQAGVRFDGLFRRLPPRLAGLMRFVVGSARALRHPLRQAMGWPLVLALAKKATEVGAVVAIQQACGIPVSLESAVLITAVLSVATTLPSPPAYVGIFEAAVLIVYGAEALAPATGLSAALLQHLAFLVPAIGCGYLMLLLRRFQPAPSPAE